MKFLRPFRIPLVALGFLSTLGNGASEPDPGQVAISVARLLENVHYSHQRLDSKLAARLLRNYLETLDYNHLFFTQADIQGFESQYGPRLAEEILNGRTLIAHQIYDLFRQRVESRITWAKEQLLEEPDPRFTTDRFVEINRQKLPWPADEAAARTLWRDRVDSELLQLKLAQANQPGSGKRLAPAPTSPTSPTSPPQDPPSKDPSGNQPSTSPVPPSSPAPSRSPAQIVAKRYDQFLKNLQEETAEDVLKTFLQCLAQTYDPHSDYMSKADLEQFNINMRLSLFGIGAKLKSEDGYAKLIELVPGGPAAKSGKLRAGDRIVAVAQDDKEFVDCVDLKLDKVVGMIRGKKDTVVRLQVIPVDALTATERNTVEIRREEVKLKDEEARAELMEFTKPNGQTVKVGWIVLPSFYGDLDHGINPAAKSTTRDVLRLLNRLKQEGIQGLVMDLRRNGGGFLDEAVNLSGLFIKKGPVVQARSWNGEVAISRDKNTRIEYDGPLVVLVNRQSASASEIFAGAMQDYKRAIIVGDSKTFGKGTVQQLFELNRALPLLTAGTEAGALKLTIQKFYRVAGGSTQLKGVESDLVIPSIYDQSEIGEESLKDPLPYDTFNPLDFDKWDKPLFLDELRRKSQTRIQNNPEFGYIQEDLQRIRTRLEENKVSLNEAQRLHEIDSGKARKAKRQEERRASLRTKDPKAFRITLDNAAKKELVPIRFVDPKPERQSQASALSEDKDRNEAPPTPVSSLENPFESEESSMDGPMEPTREKDGGLVFKTRSYRFDPVKQETLSILQDLIEFSKTDTPSTARKK